MTRPESYNELVAELRTIDPKVGEAVSLGTIPGSFKSYDLLGLILRNQQRPSPHHIFLAGGVHGEEPAGALAAVEFCRNLAGKYIDDFTFHVVPCVNPEGFELGMRVGSRGRDLNRNFTALTEEPECRAVMEWLSALRPRSLDAYVISVDLHEIDSAWAAEGFKAADNPTEFYLYEVCEDRERRIGHRLLTAGERIGPACKWERIYEDLNSGGVVSYPEANGNPVYAEAKTLEGFLAQVYTRQSFTLETPCGWPLAQRVKLHLALIEEALVALKERAPCRRPL